MPRRAPRDGRVVRVAVGGALGRDRARLEARDGRERARERRAVARRHARHLRQRPERRRERRRVDGPRAARGQPRAQRGLDALEQPRRLAHAAAAARERERFSQALVARQVTPRRLGEGRREPQRGLRIAARDGRSDRGQVRSEA